MQAPAEVIRSRSNAHVRRFRALRDKGDDEGIVLLEGPKLLEEAALSGIEILEVAASPRIERSTRGHRLVHELTANGTPVRWMHEDALASLSEAEVSQGVVALARRPDFDEESLYHGSPLLVVAVEIQSPGNLGALLRTAEAAGATGAYLTRGTAHPFSWKSLRGSMGSAFRLPHVRDVSVKTALSRLRARGIRTVATSSDAPTPYFEADLRKPLAFLFGNEGSGLPESVLHAADLQLSVPMAGAVESLNVGVAAGILLFETARQRRR
jgi:TrmH family RNA methyltransferase